MSSVTNSESQLLSKTNPIDGGGLYMADTSPRLWQYSQQNSPLPLPKGPHLFTSRELLALNPPMMPTNDSISLEELQTWVGEHTLDDGRKVADVIDVSKQQPVLLAGELANPYRLADIMAPNLVIIPIRLEGLCRTWSDGLDSREIQPGIHHVTIASSPGWWEISHLALLQLNEIKRLVTWLDGNYPGSWKPVKSAEGVIRLENDSEIGHPSTDEISWNGIEEKVLIGVPSANGPALDLSKIIIPVHTRYGCYDSRGRIIRCVHVPQRTFHDKLFRRGSSKLWSDLLKTL